MSRNRVTELKLINIKTIAGRNTATTNLDTDTWLYQAGNMSCPIARSPEVFSSKLCLKHTILCEPHCRTETQTKAITIQIVLALGIFTPGIVEINEEILTYIKAEELMIPVDNAIVDIYGINIFITSPPRGSGR